MGWIASTVKRLGMRIGSKHEGIKPDLGLIVTAIQADYERDFLGDKRPSRSKVGPYVDAYEVTAAISGGLPSASGGDGPRGRNSDPFRALDGQVYR